MIRYQYCDGSGNLYLVEGNQLRYEPVTMLQSSSGVYDGGEPRIVELTDQQVTELIEKIERTFTNRTFHVDKRTLGSAEVRIISDDSEDMASRKVMLAMRSPDKQSIEDWFARVLS